MSSFVAGVASGAWLRFFPLYVTHFGADSTSLGLVLTLGSLASWITYPIAGYLCDVIFRRRSVLILSTAGYSASLLLYAFIQNWWTIPFALALENTFGAMITTSLSALVGDSARQDKRASAFSVWYGMAIAGNVIGPSLGGFIAQTFGLLWIPATASALYGLVAGFRVFLKDPDSVKARMNAPKVSFVGQMKRIQAKGPDFRLLLVAYAIFGFSNSLWLYFVPVYAFEIIGLSFAQIGLMYSTANAVEAGMSILTGGWSDRYPRKWFLLAGRGIDLLGVPLFINSKGLGDATISLTIMFLFDAIEGPSLGALLTDLSEPSDRGTTMASRQLIYDIASTPGPYFGGVMAARIGYGPMFIAGILGYVPALALLSLMRVKKTRFSDASEHEGLSRPYVDDARMRSPSSRGPEV